MIRSVFLLCAGIIVATCFACAPAPSESPSVLPRPRPAALCNPSDPASFAASVKMLATGTNWTPEALTAPPVSSNPSLPSSQMVADLTNAFAAAPMSFRTALCNLDGVYIDPNANDSAPWGFRTPLTSTGRPGTLQRFIGLPASLWNPGPGAMIFSAYETQRVQNTTRSSAVSYKIDQSTGTDTGQETVLAALTHEYGHILWYDTFKPSGAYPSGGQFGPSDPTSCKFYRSWRDGLTGPQPFREFAAIDLDGNGNVLNEHANDTGSDNVKLQDLYNDIHGRSRGSLPGHLKSLYSAKGRWASLLGALSIDEDWVETFELLMLKNSTPPLTDLQLWVNGSMAGNIPGDDHQHGKKAQLDSKESCITSLTNLP